MKKITSPQGFSLNPFFGGGERKREERRGERLRKMVPKRKRDTRHEDDDDDDDSASPGFTTMSERGNLYPSKDILPRPAAELSPLVRRTRSERESLNGNSEFMTERERERDEGFPWDDATCVTA